MASKQDDGCLSKFDVTIKEKDVEKGFFARLVEEVKRILGRSKKGPNVKYELLFGNDRDIYIGESLKKNQLVVSEVYRVLEINKTLARDGILIVPIALPERPLSPDLLYTFHIWIKHSGHWQLEDAQYKEDGIIHGPLREMEVFYVAAELSAEEITVGPEGATFISRKDNRIEVEFPSGAVNDEHTFKFKLDMADNDRYRAYRDYLPDKFSCIYGRSSCLKVEHQLTQALQKKAVVTLPVSDIEDNELENDDECDQVYFLHWEGDTARVLKANGVVDGNCYSVEVDSFSDIEAFKSRSPEQLTEAAKYLSGKLSICQLLTFIKHKHLKDKPALYLDCVEATENRPEKRTKELEKQGLEEIKHSISRGIPMENMSRINIELGGNLKCLPIVPKSALIMHFLQYSDANHTVIPVKCSKEGISQVLFRGSKNRWEHPVHFYIFPDKCTPNYMSGKTRLPVKKRRDPVTFSSMPSLNKMVNQQGKKVPGRTQAKPAGSHVVLSDVAVLSEESLLVLSESLTNLTDWRKIGVYLGISSDSITASFNKAKDEWNLPAFELLLSWKRNSRGNMDSAVGTLIDAFSNIGRADIAETIKTAQGEKRKLTKDDF